MSYDKSDTRKFSERANKKKTIPGHNGGILGLTRSVLSSKKEILSRWAERFEELTNGPGKERTYTDCGKYYGNARSTMLLHRHRLHITPSYDNAWKHIPETQFCDFKTLIIPQSNYSKSKIKKP